MTWVFELFEAKKSCDLWLILNPVSLPPSALNHNHNHNINNNHNNNNDPHNNNNNNNNININNDDDQTIDGKPATVAAAAAMAAGA